MIIKCPECGHQVSNLAETCPSCGIAIAGNISKCPHCGGTMLANQDVCPNCLHSVHERPAIDSEPLKSPVETLPEENNQNSKVEQKPKSHRVLWTTLVVALVIALSVLFVGYYFYQHTQRQNELYAFENALQSNEPAVLQNFLDIYVEAPQEHRDTIEAHLEQLKLIDLEWQNAANSKSKTALLRYIKLHPESVHVTEAKFIIDSLDWINAANINTMESYKNYMETHGDGLHYDDAKMNYDKLADRIVTPADEKMISQLFSNYFNSLAQDDEGALMATLGNIVHEAADITGMNFLLNNDWKIDKIENIDTGEMEYAVTFSVDQRIDRSDPTQERLATYKVSAKVSPEGRIVDLNMKKVVK